MTVTTELYAQYYDLLPEMVWVCSEDGRLIYFSSAWYEYTGSTVEQSIDFGWIDYLHPDDRIRTLDHWRESVTQKKYYDIKYRFRKHTGEYRWFVARGNRKKGTWVGICTDIHENVQLAKELETQKELLATTLRQLPVAVIIGEAPSGKLAFANSKLEALLKYPMKNSKDVGEYKDWEGYHPNGKPYSTEDWPLARSIIKGETVTNEMIDMVRGDRTRTILSVSSAPVRNGDGHIVAGVVVMEDMDEKVRLQKERLEAMNEAKAAAETCRFKSKFIANMSHEIRTPINGMIGATNLLRTTALTEEQADYVDILNACGRHLMTLVDNLLDLSKIEDSKMVLEKVDFSLMDTLESTMKVAKAAIMGDKPNLNLTLVTHNLPPLVRGDSKRIEQVLCNLLGNAIKFTPDGGEVHVSMTVRSAADNGQERVILDATVRDTGIGIAPETQSKLFKPFIQADQSTTRKFGGSGLGLSICKELLTLMGGGISLDSELGEGSTFHFHVPLDAVSRGGGQNHFEGDRAEQEPLKLTELQRSQLNVLLVEDNVISARVALRLLGTNGYRKATWVENGLLAIKKFDNGELYDLVLMDCQMPVLDGFEASRSIT